MGRSFHDRDTVASARVLIGDPDFQQYLQRWHSAEWNLFREVDPLAHPSVIADACLCDLFGITRLEQLADGDHWRFFARLTQKFLMADIKTIFNPSTGERPIRRTSDRPGVSPLTRGKR